MRNEQLSAYVCFFPLVIETTVKVIKVRISLQDSGLDLNNPTVQDNILKQVSLADLYFKCAASYSLFRE